MIADYMSKPLQGKLFVSFRDVIMGWQHISTLFDIFGPTEERVEKGGRLAVKPKVKLTYAEAAKINSSVKDQDYIVSKGGNPGNVQTSKTTKITSLRKMDIKVK